MKSGAGPTIKARHVGKDRAYALTMTPIPSDPLKRPRAELTLGDGRKVKLKVPGLDPAAQPSGTAERGAADPPRDDPRLPIDPNAAGG